jgi:hypothetical protein
MTAMGLSLRVAAARGRLAFDSRASAKASLFRVNRDEHAGTAASATPA